MSFDQPKPDSKKYSDLINEIQKGIIKIPKFQRDFVWTIDKTAKLLDSILKGYPIGTFILWQTDERINDIKNVGNLDIPDTPDGVKVHSTSSTANSASPLCLLPIWVHRSRKSERKRLLTTAISLSILMLISMTMMSRSLPKNQLVITSFRSPMF